MLDNKNHGLILKNVETEIVNCKLIGNVGHAINLSDEHTFQYLKLKLVDPRQQLRGSVGGAWGLMNVAFKQESPLLALLCCSGKKQVQI